MSRDDFDTEAEYKVQLVKELIGICEDLGWMVAIPEGEEDDEIPGLVIGTEEYVNRVLDAVEDAEADNDAGTA